jgi:hypothetical protein
MVIAIGKKPRYISFMAPPCSRPTDADCFISKLRKIKQPGKNIILQLITPSDRVVGAIILVVASPDGFAMLVVAVTAEPADQKPTSSTGC